MELEIAGFFLWHRSWPSSLVSVQVVAARSNLSGLGMHSTEVYDIGSKLRVMLI
jgi:hypothetical protein